jgi:hypothetical protein
VWLVYTKEDSAYSYDGYDDTLLCIVLSENAARHRVELINKHISDPNKKAYYVSEKIEE